MAYKVRTDCLNSGYYGVGVVLSVLLRVLDSKIVRRTRSQHSITDSSKSIILYPMNGDCVYSRSSSPSSSFFEHIKL